jgi:1,4-dihydroxy-2-naphthoate octaprenyltransferase
MLQVIGTFRLPFLILTPACLLLALAIAIHSSLQVAGSHFALVLCGALAAHISVNALNEYFDFRSGLDACTERTPFSGGSGTLVSKPDLAPLTLRIGIVTLLIVIACGAYFIQLHGPTLLLPIGGVGVLLITLYTTWIVRQPLLCLIAAGSGFGLVMIVGSVVALTGQLPPATMWAAIAIFFAINNLLLLNQLPDIDADRNTGRRTLPIVVGTRGSALVYALFSALAAATIGGGIWLQQLPLLCALAFIPLMATISITLGVIKHGQNIPMLTPYLAANVAVSVTLPLTLAAGLTWG